MNTPEIKRRVTVWLAITVVAILALFSGYTWLTLHWAYSSGERAGYVQKFSRKGWICKTWEGELAMVSMPGTMSEKFPFTVRDEAVASVLNQAMGKRMALTYEQHVGLPSACFGETGYFITNARVVE